MEKRGQFFLLAAVIISAVIISLGVSTNRVIVNDGPGNFYDFSYDVKREVGAVLDYEVYSGFAGNTNLTEFVGLLAAEIEERSPGSDFIFIYGNSTKMDLKNYGSDSIYADGEEVVGLNADLPSKVCLKALCQNIDEDMVDFNSNDIAGDSLVIDVSLLAAGTNNISVEIEGNKFEFPIFDYRQVIFIMQKNIGGDRHIVVG